MTVFKLPIGIYGGGINMRMTNKIMQNNSLYNINNNKVMQDKLSTQMSTQKKITRPSDDPVIAIRALRLRTSVSELVQYHEKNSKDAESWLNVTDKSLDTVTAVLTDFIKKANTGANKEYGVDNLKIILEQMKSLRDEFYATGNVDYAGRYIFTGFRTDTPLSFNEKVEEQPDGYPKYEITEQNTIQDFDTINYTNTGGLPGLNKDNYNDPKYDPYDTSKDMTEQDVTNGDIHRLRLSYDKLDFKEITTTIGGVPSWIICPEKDTENYSGIYEEGGQKKAAIHVDFSALDAGSAADREAKLQQLVGNGLSFSCLNCSRNYRIEFVSGAPAPPQQIGGESVYQVSIDGIQSASDLVTRIIDESKTPIGNGESLWDHRSNTALTTENNDKTLIIYNPISGSAGTPGSFKMNFPPAQTITTVEGPNLTIELPDGTSLKPVTVSLKDDPYAKAQAAKNLSLTEEGAVIVVPETGEVLFGDRAYEELNNQAGNGELKFSYTKSSWSNGDLRPEHYFACKATTTDEGGNEKNVNYNQEYLRTGKQNNQKIEYDVGYNQKIQVNTNADEVFTHGLDRDVGDLERAISDLERIDATKTDLETVLKGLQEGTAEYDKVQKQYETAEKAYSYIRENVHKMFEQAISRSQKYLDDSNEAITDNGTRGQRLDLVSNRLAEQKTTFKTLQSENEDADIAEVAIQLTASELTYNAALMATSKIMQTSLMNYI